MREIIYFLAIMYALGYSPTQVQNLRALVTSLVAGFLIIPLAAAVVLISIVMR